MVLGVVGSDSQNCHCRLAKESTPMSRTLLRQHVVHWVQRMYGDSNYVLQQDLVPAHIAQITQEFLRKLCGILDSCGWAAILARPKPVGLFYLKRFAGEIPAEAPCQSAGLDLPDLLLFPPPPGGRYVEK
jgi:hypothetical protein